MSVDFKIINDSLKLQQREYKLHIATVEQIAIWHPGLRFFHVPNQTRNSTEGFFKKKMGAKAGVSDLVFSWRDPHGLQCGLIELKAPGGKLDSEQNKFLSSYAVIGWKTAICRSCREVFDTLASWGLKSGCHAVYEPDYRSVSDKKQDAYNYFAPSPQ